MIQNYKIVTLCGSTRFKEQFIEVQKRLTLEGYIVISVGMFGHSGDEEVWKPGVKGMLDDMHLRKRQSGRFKLAVRTVRTLYLVRQGNNTGLGNEETIYGEDFVFG